MDLNWLTISEAHAGLKKGEFSAEGLTRACLEQIKNGKKLNNFITVTEELALERARAVDKKLVAGEEIGMLEGIPAGIKDIFNTKGVKSTCGSKMLADFVPPYESTATRRLLDAGYVMVGKTNLDEFACGVSTEHSAFGTSLNPWDTERVAGGSSGGSASAVASGQCLFALGTDTGGSIRQPASFSGCVGLKVTYGRVSRFGVTAMASSWDTIGPMARTVEDVALVLNVLAGHDPYDATTPEVPVPDYTADLGKGVNGLKIGIPQEYFADGASEEVRAAVMAAAREYEKMGANLIDITLPMTKYGVALYYVTMPGELSTNLAKFDGVRFGHVAGEMEAGPEGLIDFYSANRGEGFGDEIKRRIMVGTFVLSAGYADAYYKQAQRVRTLLIRDFEKAFESVDVILGPVAPTPAFKVGELVNDPLAMYMADVLTIPASAAGLPSVSLPCGFTKAGPGGGGLPIGMQIIAPQFQESLALQVGAAYERVSGLAGKRPNL